MTGLFHPKKDFVCIQARGQIESLRAFSLVQLSAWCVGVPFGIPPHGKSTIPHTKNEHCKLEVRTQFIAFTHNPDHFGEIVTLSIGLECCEHYSCKTSLYSYNQTTYHRQVAQLSKWTDQIICTSDTCHQRFGPSATRSCRLCCSDQREEESVHALTQCFPRNPLHLSQQSVQESRELLLRE